MVYFVGEGAHIFGVFWRKDPGDPYRKSDGGATNFWHCSTFNEKKSKKIEHKLKTASKFEFEEAKLQTQRYAERRKLPREKVKSKDAKSGQSKQI